MRKKNSETHFFLNKLKFVMESLPQVTPEDQEKLNKFSQMMINKDRLTEELTSLEFEKEQIDDVSLELEMADEDEKIGYILSQTSTIYESFFKLKPEEIIERLETRGEKLSEKIDSLKNQVEELDEGMKNLKTELYAKFGDSINLER